MRRATYAVLALLLCLPWLLPACGAPQTSLPVAPAVVPLEGVHLDRDASQPYLTKVGFSPSECPRPDCLISFSPFPAGVVDPVPMGHIV